MQNPEQLLQQLKDIELPAGSAFAIAPGWILLLILFFIVLFIGWRLWLARKRRLSHWRLPAHASLEQINQQIMSDNRQQVLAECSKLARRFVLAREPRADVAALTGNAWLEKLDEVAGGNFFSQGNGQLLASGPYHRQAVTDRGVLEDIAAHLRELIDAPERQSVTPGELAQ